MSKVDVGLRHNHNKPFVSTCPACKLVCLACNGQKWEFYIEGDDSPVQFGGCSWCGGSGLRSDYDKTSRELAQRLPQTVSQPKPGKNAKELL
jgi:hypothetical protein